MKVIATLFLSILLALCAPTTSAKGLVAVLDDLHDGLEDIEVLVGRTFGRYWNNCWTPAISKNR